MWIDKLIFVSVLTKCLRTFTTAQEFPIPKKDDEEHKTVESSRSPFRSNVRFLYPEFLPDPAVERRHPIREKLERMDMLKRRANINIPEFYTGNIQVIILNYIF